MRIKIVLMLAVVVAAVIGLLAMYLAYVRDQQTRAALNQGLVAYLPFNGNARDASGNGNDGTVSDATLTANRFGKAESAYYFPGKHSHIEVSNSPSLGGTNAVSVAAWIKIEAGGTEQPRIVHKHVYDLALTDPGPSPGVFFKVSRLEEGAETLTTPTLPTNQWIFVAGTYDRQTLCLYTNGMLVARVKTSIPIEENTLNIGIGRNLETSGDWFKGCIDEVRIYDRALSEADVRKLHRLR